MERIRSEDGFTLPELLIAIVILAIIVGPMAMAFAVTFRTETDTGNRLSLSGDAQIASAYFGTDVQSADLVVKGALSDGAGDGVDPNYTCVPSSRTPLVSMAWTNDTGKTDVFVDPGTGEEEESSIDQRLVSYYVATVSGERRLMRRNCEGAIFVQTDPVTGEETDTPVYCQAPATCTQPTTDVTIAHFLAPTEPTATCNPDLCSLTDTQTPDSVAISIHGCVLDATGGACTPDSAFDYQLSASRRSVGG
jgi:prepilin-type N-terminal cleavage/methylation domain-containing protein